MIGSSIKFIVRGGKPVTPSVRPSLSVAFRYGLASLKNNVVYYLLYEAFAGMEMDIKTSATLVFIIAIIYSFQFNKFFVFGSDGASRFRFIRYVMVYAVVWAMNMAALELFVTRWRFDHHIVQAGIVAIIGPAMFLALRAIVFTPARTTK